MPNRLKELRARAGLTQHELAKAASTRFQTIGKLENADRKLTIEWMERLAPGLGVRPAAIMDAAVELLADPQRIGEVVNDPTERDLLDLWRVLTPDMREAILTISKANAALIRGSKAA